MWPAGQSRGWAKPGRLSWTDAGGCLLYLLAWPGVLWAPGAIWRGLGWPYAVAYGLLAVVVIGLVRISRLRRRGLTARQAIAADRAERRQRAASRQRARQDAAVLPWLTDMRSSPADHPGVLVTPAPDAPAGLRHGYDVVLDSAGEKKIQVVRQVMKLTSLPLKEAKDLIDGLPVALLRVPERRMACAAKSVLEAAGATVSVTDEL